MSTPGRRTPGLASPQFDQPGRRTPGDGEPSAPAETGVAVDATGTTTLGTVEGDRDQVQVVTVNGTAADFDFQVTVGDTAVFDTAQSPGSTNEETFQPDTATFTAAEDEDVVFEVTSASATGGATADVTVDVVSDDMV